MKWNEPAPEEREAGERSWEVVRTAWEARTAHPRPHRNRLALVPAAVALAIVAAIVTPPGHAVLNSIRDAIGRSTTRDELTSLPATGRLLVNSPNGAWVVSSDGSKRHLAGYADAAWSPHGLYLAAARGNELVAMEPNGRIHWTLARSRPIGAPQWSYEGYRIAYLAGPSLRIVNGDGTGDRLLAPDVVHGQLPAFAWRPATHELAYKSNPKELELRDVDSERLAWRRAARDVTQLLWSNDGRRLYVAASRSEVLGQEGRRVAALPAALAAAFRPQGEALALVVGAKRQSSVVVFSGPRYTHKRVLFSAPGVFAGIAWSPDGRWLLVDWSTADEWVFIRATAARKVITVADVQQTFRGGPEAPPTVSGWCCP